MGNGVPFVEWTGELRSYARLSYKGRTVDALALGPDEGRN